MSFILKIVGKILPKPIKNALKQSSYVRNLSYILNFNQEVIDEFITEVVRKEVPQGSKILDVGAGTVRYKNYFSDCIYLTQDFKQYEDPSGNFQYGEIDYVSDIIDIPVDDNSFDVIICTETFEHIPRPDLAVKEFSRILISGGKLYITAPLGSGVHFYPYHYYGGCSKSWYIKYLKEYGFKEIVIKPKKRFFALYAQYTQRALMYLKKSEKWRHKFFLPVIEFLSLVLPIYLFGLDKYNLDDYDPLTEFTIGYLVKARKS
jgi:ubiquinone/menaquinone biosynthesis C-methylase UbiE